MNRSLHRVLLLTLVLVFTYALFCLWYVLFYLNGETLLEELLISEVELVSPETAPGSLLPASPLVPSSRLKNESVGLQRIPRILHQTYKVDQIPQPWLEAQASCVSLLDGNWTYMFWTDQRAQEFLTQHYPWFLPCYQSYPYNIQRADAIRYFALHHYGGFYIDLDVGCVKDLSPLLRYDMILAKTYPVGVSNDVMAAAKDHIFMERLIRNLAQSNHIFGTKYPTVFFSTGPMYITGQLITFLHHAPSQQRIRQHHGNVSSSVVPSSHFVSGGAGAVRILPPRLYGSTPTSFFTHHPGSSWHGYDVLVISLLVRERQWIAALMSVSCCLYMWIRRFRPLRKCN